MDSLETKNNNLLQRLRGLQLEQCCLHIDKQIGTWYQKSRQQLLPAEEQTTTTTTITSATPATATIKVENVSQQVDVTVTTADTNLSQETKPILHQTLSKSTPDATTTSTTTTSTTTATTTTTTTLSTITPTAATPSTTLACSSSSISNNKNININSNSNLPSSLSSLSEVYFEDYERTIGCFLSNIKHLEKFDSDATESTSSNDSYDELESFSHEDIPTKKPNTFTSYKYPKPRQYPQTSTSSSPVAASTTNSLSHHHQQQQHHHNQPQLPLPQPQQPQLSSSQQHQQQLATHQHHQQQQQAHHQTIHQRRISTQQQQQQHQPQQHQQQQNHSGASTSVAIVNPNNYDPSDLKKKAIWKWANERSRLASRWTWLQAQIADLEFRIRGQNDATMNARAHKTPPLPPVLPENSCSRTVPISKDFRRRRLIKSSQILSNSNKKLVKFSQVPCICSSLPQTVAPCLSCNGRYNYLRQIDGENAPLSERITLLDPCCHPVLSFPDDITLGSQLSYLLKQETINRKPTMGKRGRKKGSTAANLAAAAAANAERNGKNPANRKYYKQLGRPPGSKTMKNQSKSMLVSNKLRQKYRAHSNNYDSNWTGNNNHQARRNKRIRRASSINESSVCSESSNQYRPNNFSNNSSAQNVTRRRRSEQSAYDIDNIVIPVSLAATTRVEILEYKEIMTPSWRVWENGTCQATESSVNAEVAAASQDTNANPAPSTAPEDIEDTSDEAYILRHSKGESEEKKRFTLKVPA